MDILINILEVVTEKGQRRFAFTSSLDTEVQRLANPFDEVQDALVRWYLEEHPIHDPLEKRKASLAEIELNRYGARIAELVGLSQPSKSRESGETSIKIQQEDGNDVSGHALLWETLEGADDTGDGAPVVVSRLVTPNVKSQLPPKNEARPFRILLVVARTDMTESNHRIIATTLLHIADAMGPSRIEVEIARPGTYDALREKLIRSSKPFDLVHFDVHGVVGPVTDQDGHITFESYLEFFPQNETGSGLRKASDLATLLSQNHIPMVVVNACESARSDRGPLANLAHVLVRNGVPMVLAMSYKLQVDALSIFFEAFYQSFLQRGRDFCQSTADGRRAMRLNKKRRGCMGVDLDLLDWIVPTAYTASGFDPTLMCATPSVPGGDEAALPGMLLSSNQELDNVDQAFDMEVLNVETRLCDPWQCGAGPIVNICGFDGIGKHTFLQHCQQWWTRTAFFDRILMYSHPRGQAYPTATEIQAWMASQLEPVKNLGEVSADEVVVGWTGRGRNRKRLLVMLENFSLFKIEAGLPMRSLSLEDEQEWHGLFEWMTAKKICAVVSSCSKLELVSTYPSGEDEEHTFPMEPIRYKGGQETPVNSPYYYLPGMCEVPASIGAPRTFFASLTNTEDLSGMRSLIDCLAGLPRMVELALGEGALEAKIAGKSISTVVTYLTSGHDVFRQDEESERHLKDAVPMLELLDSYLDRQAPVSKAIVFGLSLFTKYLGRKLESYSADFVVHLSKVLSSVANLTANRSIDRLDRRLIPSWATQLVLELGTASGATTRGLISDHLRKVIWDLSALGLLRKDFFFIELESEGTDSESASIAPLYRIHPCLTIFLRRQLAKHIAQIAPDEASVARIRRELNTSFIRYHRNRLDDWSTSPAPSVSFFGMAKSFEQEQEKLNFLGALEMWLEDGNDHRDYAYPKRLFNNFFIPFPGLTNRIEPNLLAPFVSRIQGRLSQVFQSLDRESRPPEPDTGGKKVYQFMRRLNIFQRHAESAEATERKRVRTRWQYYAALVFFLKLGNWLLYYHVVHGKPESAAEQICRSSQVVSVYLTPYRLHETISSAFPFWLADLPRFAPAGVRIGPPKLAQELYMINNSTGLSREEQIVEMVSSSLLRARSVTLQSWTKAYEDGDRRFEAFQAWLLDSQDEAQRRWSATGLELLKKGWGQKRSVETWGYRTREEVQVVSLEVQGELRQAFIALAEIPQSFLDRSVEALQVLARMVGRWIRTQGNENTAADSDTEEATGGGLAGVLAALFGSTTSEMQGMIDDIDVKRAVESMPGMEGLMEVWGIVKRGLAELQASASPGKVFDDFYPQLQKIDAQFWWRRALVSMLAVSMHENQLFKVVSAHQLLIKSYMDRGDWEGLDQHLRSIDLDAEQGGKCQWYAVRGICSMHLRKWGESGIYLKRSLDEMSEGKRGEYMLGNFGIFGLAGGFTIQFMLLRFLVAVKYSGGDEGTPGLLPAWGIFLEALGLGYGAPMGLLYRWNGSILEQLCQHYLEPPGSHRDPERVIDMPAQADYGAAIRDYMLPARLAEGMDVTEMEDYQTPLFLLLEFLHCKRAKNEMAYEKLADFNASKAFFDLYSHRDGAPKLRLSQDSASVVFLNALMQELSVNWEKRLDVLETFEHYLMGKRVAGAPESLARMGECPVVEGPAGES